VLLSTQSVLSYLSYFTITFFCELGSAFGRYWVKIAVISA